MKRSEMLLLIVNQLHFLDGHFSGYVKDVTEEELKRADVILTTIEAAGMQPPLNVNSEGFSFFYEWEDEE